jgi:hypothetical protein
MIDYLNYFSQVIKAKTTNPTETTEREAEQVLRLEKEIQEMEVTY